MKRQAVAARNGSMTPTKKLQNPFKQLKPQNK